MTFTGNKDMYCNDRKCKKRTRHVSCNGCRGKGNTTTTHCSWCGGSGYKCENGNEKYHG